MCKEVEDYNDFEILDTRGNKIAHYTGKTYLTEEDEIVEGVKFVIFLTSKLSGEAIRLNFDGYRSNQDLYSAVLKTNKLDNYSQILEQIINDEGFKSLNH